MLQKPAQYFPFHTGKYNTQPNLSLLGKGFGNQQSDGLVFQIDENFKTYHQNKLQCRKENLEKYHLVSSLQSNTLTAINQFLIKKLVLEYPHFFHLENNQLRCYLTNDILNWDENYQLHHSSIYISLFDALAHQVQEDLAVVQLTSEDDYLMLIHLCAPNYWSPEEKIGKNFASIHYPVAEMKDLNQRYRPMLETIVKKTSTYVRFAWGLTTDKQLNHHPTAPPSISQSDWEGRSFDLENPELFVRIERQTLTGFPKMNAFLFTIRTYFEEVKSLEKSQIIPLKQALFSMSEATLDYKGLTKDFSNISRYLDSLIENS